MNREQIRNVAINRMTQIEDKFERHVPFEVQQYYLLLHLIIYGINQYVRTYGLQQLDADYCREGKDLAGYGSLSPFENDCVKFLNTIMEAREREGHSSHSSVVGLRSIG